MGTMPSPPTSTPASIRSPGEGLADALDGADVVVDVSNPPSFEDSTVPEFFQASTANILAAAKAAGEDWLGVLATRHRPATQRPPTTRRDAINHPLYPTKEASP
jgi:hypothetical protein